MRISGRIVRMAIASSLLLTAWTPARAKDEMERRTESAGRLLNFGYGLSFISIRGFIPIIYDAGMLTMISAKAGLAEEYQKKFKEPPPQFGETGNHAYLMGWALKGAGVGGLILTLNTDYLIMGVLGLPILWLIGTAKHYEAQRQVYVEANNTKTLILDKNETLRAPPAALRLGYTLGF